MFMFFYLINPSLGVCQWRVETFAQQEENWKCQLWEGFIMIAVPWGQVLFFWPARRNVDKTRVHKSAELTKQMWNVSHLSYNAGITSQSPPINHLVCRRNSLQNSSNEQYVSWYTGGVGEPGCELTAPQILQVDRKSLILSSKDTSSPGGLKLSRCEPCKMQKFWFCGWDTLELCYLTD